MTLEVHLTYKCNLKCVNCNRGVGMGVPHTPDMTLDGWRAFLKTVPEYLKIKGHTFGVVFTGGEPTLCDIEAFVKVTYEEVERSRVGIFSNAATPHAKKLIAYLWEKYGIRNRGSEKPGGQPDYEFATDMFLSPVDTGFLREWPCQWSIKCGSSVDSGGMTLCPIGGVIDGTLKLGLRTTDWSTLTKANLMKLCAHCGRGMPEPPADKVFMVNGFRMTREWKDAVERST